MAAIHCNTAFKSATKPLASRPRARRAATAHGALARQNAAMLVTSPTTQALPSQLHSRSLGRQVTASALTKPVAFFGNSRNVEFSVVKIQLAMFGDIPKYQRTLDRIADTDTSDEDGLYEITQGIARFVVDRLSNCQYGLIRNKGCEDMDEAEEFYNKVSMEERSKFSEETLVNFSGRTRSSGTAKEGDMLDSWLCLTVIAAIEGDIQFPKANTLMDVKKCMEMLRVLEPEDLVAVELLWSPQQAGDSYSREELLADCPTLMTLT